MTRPAGPDDDAPVPVEYTDGTTAQLPDPARHAAEMDAAWQALQEPAREIFGDYSWLHEQ